MHSSYLALEDDPLWYKEAIIYELHVKAFLDSNADGSGDFRGLTQKLDYLTDLGVTAIWLLPFYPSPFKDDGYDISDYRSIHPAYGVMRDFRQFLKAAHRRGLRVITELVVNHTSDQHPWFQAARRAKPGSAKRNMYVWSDDNQKFSDTRVIFCDTESSNWTWDPLAKAYYWHRFYSHQPDLNLNNPRVVKQVLKVLRFWFDQGVDGLRLDAIPYLCVREGTTNENLPETHQVLKQIRSFVDTNFSNRMLLAEANQWPEDVRPYFGDGDECHMAFHFPLMPRIFIALRREDSEPIIEIMDKTPEIPDSCQWALFLRNHDELTLEMVTDEERDYLWQEYANDSRMRLNLGIRRRLASLVDNSVRRLELLNSIMLSFPGTPIIYYGDEIGMGDNVFLGDRDGVRTPMQWSSDRNAGFSRANPAELFLPVIMDPVYGYEAVNVESQERDPSSFLNFMKRLLALRKQYKAFARGSLQFVRPKNRKVLVYFRKYREEVIMCVINLSRFVQPVELDLSEHEGWYPIEIFGRTEFPCIGSLPYFLTLGPHAFYWFKLEPESQPIRRRLTMDRMDVELRTIMTESVDEDIFEQRFLRSEIEDCLLEFMEEQPWFNSSMSNRTVFRIQETAKIGVRLYFVFVQVDYADGTHDLYSIPLRVVVGDIAETLVRNVPESVIALIKTPRGGGVLVDAMYDKTACKVLMHMMHNERTFAAQNHSVVHSHSTRVLDEAIHEPETLGAIAPLTEARGNTSVNCGNRLVLKLYRKVEQGVHPELELGMHVGLNSKRGLSAQVAGWIDWKAPSSHSVMVAICYEYIPHVTTAWHKCSEISQRMVKRDMECPGVEICSCLQTAPVLGNTELNVEVQNWLGSNAGYFESIGERVAELHTTLVEDYGDKSFLIHPFGETDLVMLSGKVIAGVSRLLSTFTIRSSENDKIKDLVEQIIAGSDSVRELINVSYQKLQAVAREGRLIKIRVHGKLNLNQILDADGLLTFINFEGDESEPLAKRRFARHPMRDMGELLFSLAEAVVVGCDDASLESDNSNEYSASRSYCRMTDSWYRSASACLFGRYAALMKDTKIEVLPPTKLLLRLFTLDVALRKAQKCSSDAPVEFRKCLQAVLLVYNSL